MSNNSFRMTRPACILLAALGIALISGCSTYPKGTQQQAQYVLNNDPAKLLADDALNGFLSQAPAGSVTNLTKSPWGQNVEIVADAPYLAASGRECRKLRVVEVGSARSALVCQTPNGWVNQRAIIQADTSSQGRY